MKTYANIKPEVNEAFQHLMEYAQDGPGEAVNDLLTLGRALGYSEDQLDEIIEGSDEEEEEEEDGNDEDE